jgi:methionine sulfoxide reductase heme-binding subunit
MVRIKPNWPKIIVNSLAFIPLAWLIISWSTGNLGPNPIQKAQIFLGDTALIMLLISLSITPIKTITGYAKISKFKKTIGLQSFYHALLHVFVYIGVDYNFDFKFLFKEFLHLWYLWAGVPAFLILLVLAITSLRSLKVKLGKLWKPIHRFVYLVGVLVVIHYLLVMKGGLSIFGATTIKPLIAGGVLILLLIARLPFKRWFNKTPQSN